MSTNLENLKISNQNMVNLSFLTKFYGPNINNTKFYKAIKLSL